MTDENKHLGYVQELNGVDVLYWVMKKNKPSAFGCGLDHNVLYRLQQELEVNLIKLRKVCVIDFDTRSKIGSKCNIW